MTMVALDAACLQFFGAVSAIFFSIPLRPEFFSRKCLSVLASRIPAFPPVVLSCGSLLAFPLRGRWTTIAGRQSPPTVTCAHKRCGRSSEYGYGTTVRSTAAGSTTIAHHLSDPRNSRSMISSSPGGSACAALYPTTPGSRWASLAGDVWVSVVSELSDFVENPCPMA